MISPEQQRAHDAHVRFHASLRMLALPKPPREPAQAPRDLIHAKTPGRRDFLWVASPPENRTATIKRIQTVVAFSYGVSVLDIVSERRTKNVVMPRQIAMYLARTLTTRSLPEIGKAFGGRDHTTALHAYTKIKARISAYPAFSSEVEEMARMVSAPKTNPGELGSSGA